MLKELGHCKVAIKFVWYSLEQLNKKCDSRSKCKEN
jgi:hypothetical protein